MALLEEGATLPDFQPAACTEGGEVGPADLRGTPVVLFFYPKADTPGCTVESKAFRDRNAAYAELGVKVYGVSNDALDAQQAFCDKFTLGLPLLAGAGGDLCEVFGAVGGSRRITYLFDAEGICRRVWAKVDVGSHADEVLEACRDLVG